MVARARARELPPAEVQFTYADHAGKVSALEPFAARGGWLQVTLLAVESLDQAEEHLIVAAVTDDGRELEGEVAARLLTLPGRVLGPPAAAISEEKLELVTRQRGEAIERGISERNGRVFEAEVDKLEGWADDLKLGLEREIKELDRQIKEARRAATMALTLEEKLAGQKQIKSLEAQRNQKRRSLFDAQDEVDRKRQDLISNIEGKLQQRVTSAQILEIRWRLA